MVAVTWPGVDVAEVEGVGMPVLVSLVVIVLAPAGDTGP